VPPSTLIFQADSAAPLPSSLASVICEICVICGLFQIFAFSPGKGKVTSCLRIGRRTRTEDAEGTEFFGNGLIVRGCLLAGLRRGAAWPGVRASGDLWTSPYWQTPSPTHCRSQKNLRVLRVLRARPLHAFFGGSSVDKKHLA